jgi:outer membrane lipoprotein-sorting protein
MKKHITQKKFNGIIAKKYWLRSIFFSVALSLIFFIGQGSSIAKENPSLSQKISEHQEDIKNIENFLNNISNLTANFTQNTSENSINGKFYLSRNKDQSGKMRVEYFANPKILIVVNGPILSYQDIELDEISRISTNTTPASFLTRPNISFFSKDIQITNFEKSAELIKISLLKKNRKEAGEFSLIFKTSPLEFIKMEVKNDLGQIVSVTLKNIDFTSSIPNKLFIIKDDNF